MTWQCLLCGLHNWDTRSQCRGCPPATTPGTAAASEARHSGKGRLGKGRQANDEMNTTLSTASSISPAAAEASQDGATAQEDRAALQAQLTSLESAIAALGESAAPDIWQGLQDKAEQVKQRLRDGRPLGQRLEGLRGAIQRGEARLLKAQMALQEAQKRVTDETDLLERRQQEMRAMETELIKDLSHAPSRFRQTSEATVPPWVASKLQYFAQQLRAGNLTNPAALADQLLLLGQPANTAGHNWEEEQDNSWEEEQEDDMSETPPLQPPPLEDGAMECTQ